MRLSISSLEFRPFFRALSSLSKSTWARFAWIHMRIFSPVGRYVRNVKAHLRFLNAHSGWNRLASTIIALFRRITTFCIHGRGKKEKWGWWWTYIIRHAMGVGREPTSALRDGGSGCHGGVHVGLLLRLHYVFLVADPLVAKPIGDLHAHTNTRKKEISENALQKEDSSKQPISMFRRSSAV